MTALITIRRIPAFVAGLFGYKSSEATTMYSLVGKDELRRVTLTRVRNNLIAISNHFDQKHDNCSEDSYVTRNEYAAESRRYFRFGKAVDEVLAGRATSVDWSVRVEYVEAWEAIERAEDTACGLEWVSQRDREQAAHESMLHYLAADIQAMRNCGVCVDTRFEAISIEEPRAEEN